METFDRLPNQCCDSPATIGVVEQQNEDLRQRMSEMEHSNPSSIHGTETTSYPAGSLSENDTSTSMTNQRESEHELISEPIRHPEIRRMIPSEDVESETDDLHLWYTTRGSERQGSVNLKNEHNSGNSTTDAKSSSDTKFDELESEIGANDAILSEKSNESGQVRSMPSPSASILQIEGKIGRNEAVFAEAVHASAFSEAPTAQHLHDSTVTTATFEGENGSTEVTPNHHQNGEFGSENGSDRFPPQNRITENSISGSKTQKFTTNCELGPENSISGPESTQNTELGPNSGPKSEKSANFWSETGVSGQKSQNQSNSRGGTGIPSKYQK